MEINNKNPSIKKKIYTRKKEQDEKVGRKQKDGSDGSLAKSAGDAKEFQVSARKAISRSQAILGGLELIKDLSGSESGEGAQLVHEVVEKTVFDHEQVLKGQENLLVDAVLYHENNKIDNIIIEETNKINTLFSELGKTATTQQNLLSVDSSLGKKGPEELLQSVILQLKVQGDPHTNLPANRVLNLLGE